MFNSNSLTNPTGVSEAKRDEYAIYIQQWHNGSNQELSSWNKGRNSTRRWSLAWIGNLSCIMRWWRGKTPPQRPGPARLGYLLHYASVPDSLGWFLSRFLQPCSDCSSSPAGKAAKITREETRHQKWNKRRSEWRAAVGLPMRRVSRVFKGWKPSNHHWIQR